MILLTISTLSWTIFRRVSTNWDNARTAGDSGTKILSLFMCKCKKSAWIAASLGSSFAPLEANVFRYWETLAGLAGKITICGNLSRAYTKGPFLSSQHTAMSLSGNRCFNDSAHSLMASGLLDMTRNFLVLSLTECSQMSCFWSAHYTHLFSRKRT